MEHGDPPSEREDFSSSRRSLNIALVSDYFFPKVGGVESSIYNLAQSLVKRGHRVRGASILLNLDAVRLTLSSEQVVVITHAYPPRNGVRWLPNGVKVYYVPVQPLPPTHVHATLPNFFTAFPWIRSILTRECIEVVHAHAALSALGMETIMHARTMGVKAVFTDHSLFGLGNMAEIWGNKMLKGCLSDVEAVTCVSHTSKENTVLRGALNPSLVHVIPNAVVVSQFRPTEPVPPVPDILTIVCISRLVYRKGIDLLIAALPKVCALHSDVRFLIGGDGPKIVELDQMRDKYQTLLRNRVELLGAVKHEDVRELLSRAQIFLNPSLTEAFGIGILEAACAGLFVVSTRVGGVPEVLPPGLVEFAEPDVDDLVRAISRAITHVRSGSHDPLLAHDQLRQVYSWTDVAERTERVYYHAMSVPRVPLVERLRRYYGTGAVFGKIMCIVIIVDYILLAVMDYLSPRDKMDRAPKFDLERWKRICRDELEKEKEADLRERREAGIDGGNI
ncbi:Phosphatidylinositol N-acetylglucosaminyltransferase GPI3 subunit [Rhodotorula toruloides]